MTDTHLGY